MSGPAVVILAAGMGSRMKSSLPKTLHSVAGRPMLAHVVHAAQVLNPTRIVVVVGHGAREVEDAFRGSDLVFATQHEQLGTGHALIQAQSAVGAEHSSVVVLNGDGPLIRGETLAELVQFHHAADAGMTLATTHVADPTGLGRIVRGSNDLVERIVEEKDASLEERTITEINPGLYVFDTDVFTHAANLTDDNEAGEYYITDLVAAYRSAGANVAALPVPDERELLGINDRTELARAERILQDRYRAQWLAAGVSMVAPETVFFGPDVHLERDVVLGPGVVLQGTTTVGEGAYIGAYSVLVNATVPPRLRVLPHTLKSEL